jgi:DNA-binding NtrC family response regulator
MNDGLNILIADRNRHVREFLQRELHKEGYSVQAARDGREVLLNLSSDRPPNLLILDLDIPTDGGLSLLKEIRKHYPGLPVVIHTLLTELAGHPGLEGIAAFVEKSGNTDVLRRAVREVLGVVNRGATMGDPDGALSPV